MVVSMFALEPVPDLCGQGVIAKLILMLRYLVYVWYTDNAERRRKFT